MVTDEIRAICQKCEEEFSPRFMVVNGETVITQKTCGPCVEKINAGKKPWEEKLDHPWRLVCPRLYQGTDPEKLPVGAETIEKVLGWTVQPKGIALSGPSGSGKTRLMYLLLKRIIEEGTRARACTAKEFERWVHRMFEKDDDAKVRIEEARIAKVLFLDDIGKEKYTERVESEFYDLIEYRTSNLLPTLWTANATGEELQRMLGADRGEPIIRRLREFTQIISL